MNSSESPNSPAPTTGEAGTSAEGAYVVAVCPHCHAVNVYRDRLLAPPDPARGNAYKFPISCASCWKEDLKLPMTSISLNSTYQSQLSSGILSSILLYRFLDGSI
jgi:hypothetical protein